MVTRTAKVCLVLSASVLAYVFSYLACRYYYQTKEDAIITPYDEDGIGAAWHIVHWPLIKIDTAITGRRIAEGNWRY